VEINRCPQARGVMLRRWPATFQQREHIVSCHVMFSEWAVHLMDTDGQTRIGPWLLSDSHDEALRILTWGHITPGDIAEHHGNMARWGVGGMAPPVQPRATPHHPRGHGWP
jgi:hypothetical protein